MFFNVFFFLLILACPLKLKLCRIGKHFMYSMNIPLFFLLFFVHYFGIWIITLAFLDSVKVRFLKRCMIITLLGVCRFIPGLMTLILFQGRSHVCQNINCIVCFYGCDKKKKKKIVHRMLVYDSYRYLLEMIIKFLVGQVPGLIRNYYCCFLGHNECDKFTSH